MKTEDVNRLALIYAIQAEIDGMKEENQQQREQQGYSMAWTEKDFLEKANELRELGKPTKEQVVYYKCPVCDGRGNVPSGFYSSNPNISRRTNVGEVCRSCNGNGFIWKHE